MRLNKYSKVVAILLLFLLILPCINVNASAIGWPVDVSATEQVDNVGEESLPLEAIESSVGVLDEGTESSGGLSAIDKSDIEIKNESIFPEEEYGLVNRLQTGPTSSDLDETAIIYSNYSNVVPTVTTTQMVQWIMKKGNEVISILQIFAQPFAIIIFIVSCAICLIGALTKGNMMGKGLIGMVASAILYAACIYAPLLVNSISSFLAS